MINKIEYCDLLDFYTNTEKYIGIDSEKSLSKVFDNIPSSFGVNKFWKVFYYIGRYIYAESVCELGVLHGYSLIAVALGDLSNKSNKQVYGYDLFDDYPYNNGSEINLKNLIANLNISNIQLIKKNIVNDNFNVSLPIVADIYIIDLSNCGEIISSSLEKINWSITKLVIIEGGSVDRDSVEWMIKYNRRPIYPYLVKSSDNYFIYISNKFPSMTFIFKDVEYRDKFSSFFDVKMEMCCNSVNL